MINKKKMNMKLVGKHILCKRIVEKKETTSGLILPTNFESNNDYKVLLVGNRVEYIIEGDIVRKFLGSDGVPIIYNGEDCLLLKENEDIELVLSRSESNI